jgi:ADP-ribosyl-[dinitrogen reductase] hydrolase
MAAALTLAERFRGILLGTAVGDALGLPAEGMSPARARRLFGETWRHRLVFGRGMVSDDTEHALFVSQCLLAHPERADLFARRLAWCLRWWFASLPAGIGFATLRAILRLWLGFGPARSGVRSAGNGPAMRSAPIGAFFASAPEKRQAYLESATRITHTDSRALTGAAAVALVAGWAIQRQPSSRPALDEILELLRAAGENDTEWRDLLGALARAEQRDWTVSQFADGIGLGAGVTGYVYHTVPVALYSWFRHFGDFESTLTAVLDCGGDTDTSGAIAGAVAGAVVGDAGIPDRWIGGIRDWPRGPRLLAKVADRLAAASGGGKAAPVRYFWPGVPARNLLFLTAVLAHGLRRLAPPYAAKSSHARRGQMG